MSENVGQIKFPISRELLITDLVGNLMQDLEVAVMNGEWGIAGATADTISRIMKEIGGDE